MPGLVDVNSDLQISSPEVIVDIDRDRASALGVTADQIEDALYSAYGSRQVSDIYTPDQRLLGDAGDAAAISSSIPMRWACSTSARRPESWCR